MKSTAVSIGDTATASQYNNLRIDAGLFSGDEVNITYNTDGSINTVEHVDYGVTYTLTYSATGLVSSVTDGVDAWHFTYTSGNLTKILKV